MIPKQIIEKAIEGDWSGFSYGSRNWCGARVPDIEQNHWRDIALDPTFWQALGKSCGWKEGVRVRAGRNAFNPEGTTIDREWQDKARYFYDLILTGQPTDKFWADLLT